MPTIRVYPRELGHVQWAIPQTRNKDSTKSNWCHLFYVQANSGTHRSRLIHSKSVLNKRIFRNEASRELKIAKESNDLAKVLLDLELNQKSINEHKMWTECFRSKTTCIARDLTLEKGEAILRVYELRAPIDSNKKIEMAQCPGCGFDSMWSS